MPTAADPPEHYFTTAPAAPRAPREVRVVIGNEELLLASDSSVFSGDHLDPGTGVLLATVPDLPPGASVLDLGCGYGAIACSLARRSPDSRVLAVDVNDRALELTLRNAERHALHNLTALHPDAVDPALRFDAIYSNPPIRVGKAQLHALLLRWLDRLTPDGTAYLVVHRHLGSDSLQRWLVGHGWPCTRMRSVRGYRVLAVRRGSTG